MAIAARSGGVSVTKQGYVTLDNRRYGTYRSTGREIPAALSDSGSMLESARHGVYGRSSSPIYGTDL
ncbi:hypothetical protein Pan189_04400 [Stratiformator vulcanicus]|uniref:Uncharacterized protein n=1 Tax=Stratiformator vulcanicus TaxID=2527980 RepID=A0A517QWP0_9PLAN|nr:hypothetical protein Pan189_04400 [Stratiformator vulcanicus]